MEAPKFFDVERDILKEENFPSESKQSPERPSSPADCAICLEQLKDKSFTNSCLHMFCFHCLEAWSKVKPECPLCKQDFCSIIHNIRSMTDYDEYHVPPVETRYSVSPPYVSPREIADSYAAHDFFSNRRRFFSYRTTIMPNTFSIPRIRSSNLVIQPYIDNSELENNFSRASSTHSSAVQCNRIQIYLRGLETRPPTSGRYRESNPQFYRENETQLHRMARWIHRELMALSRINVRFVLHDVEQLIMNMLGQFNIDSSIFHNTLSQYLGGHTSRFIRELYNFATSPYEIDQYDRECVFVQRRNGSQLSFIVTVGRDETEDVQVIPNTTTIEEPIRPWIDFSRNLTVSSSSLNFLFRPIPVTITPSSTRTSTSVINLTDSENEDCVIIDDAARPETIVLDDSDEEPSNPIPSTSAHSAHDSDPFFNSYRPLDLSTSRSISSQTTSPPPAVFPNPAPANAALEASVIVEAEVKADERAYHKSRRSRSVDSSVLSTSISSDESEPPVYKKKRSKRLCRAKSKRTSAHRRFSSDEFLNESSTESAQSESDWEESKKKRRKKKKSHAGKREKKPSSKRRKKSSERKSKKRKVSVAECDSTEYKSKLRKAKMKTKERHSRSSTVAVDRSAGKLSSVVKVVHRDLDHTDQPSTSSGCRGCRSDFTKLGRHVFFTDSD